MRLHPHKFAPHAPASGVVSAIGATKFLIEKRRPTDKTLLRASGDLCTCKDLRACGGRSTFGDWRQPVDALDMSEGQTVKNKPTRSLPRIRTLHRR